MLAPPGSRAIRSRLVVVPATPNGMPAATAMMSPGSACPRAAAVAQA